MEKYSLKLTKNLHNNRLDKVITKILPNHSRSFLQRLIKNGNVKINDIAATDNAYKVKENSNIEITIPDSTPSDLIPAYIPLDIVYEDQDLLVINKQAGLTVHPGAGNHQDTLANALIGYTDFLSSGSDEMRPGIVHRIDKDTSGLMVVAKNDFAHMQLAKQIQDRKLIRKYQALVWGVIKPLQGRIETNIGRSPLDRKKMTVLKTGGKNAITHYETLEIFYDGLISLVECKLETGRTHQIRVHLSHIGNSIVGDQTYGQNSRKVKECTIVQVKNYLQNFKRQALHSYYIAFKHPCKNESLEFTRQIPQDMLQIIEILKS